MKAKSRDLAKLNECFEKEGNQILVLYGAKGCQKEELIREFIKDKSHFYYRARQASANEQKNMFAREVSKAFDSTILKNTYDEFFNRVKSNGPSKLVIVIDEAQFIVKKDAEFVASLIKLKAKKLYAGPVMVILTSSSIVWAENELEDYFKEDIRKIDQLVKVENLNFLEAVHCFPDSPVVDTIKMYGIIGGVPDYMDKWDGKKRIKDNVCKLILSQNGPLFREAENIISSELRELSVYETILATIARGDNKLNDLFHATGFSRAKISVYMKNLAHFDIVEKVISFETGGWDNAKKGVYQIKDTFVNFWFRYVYPNLTDLYIMSPEEFYDKHISWDLNIYLQRYFRNVCAEYLMILNKMGKLPFDVKKIGTWLGKEGQIDIIAQSSDRRNIIGFCNWDKPLMTMKMCEEMALTMDKAKLSSEHYFIFSATDFEIALREYVKKDPNFVLVDMNQL